MSIQAFSDALAASRPSMVLQETLWAIPAIQSVHILALCVVLASMAMLSLRMMGVAGRRDTLDESARRFLPPTWWALVVMLLSGALLVLAEPARELLNPAFAVKMVLVVAAVISALLLGRTLRRAAGSGAGLKLAGLGFLVLWVTIAVLGRWIAYVDTGA